MKISYILNTTLVVVMSLALVLDVFKNGFNSENISECLTILILAGAFFDNYRKDKIIQRFTLMKE